MQDDIRKLQGTWNVVALEIEGNALSKGVFGGSKIIVDGNQFTTVAMGAAYEGTFSVNMQSTPKSIDLNFTSGPEKGSSSLGIYELDGETWTLCLTISGKTRPDKFATSPQSGHALETLVRESGDGRSLSESGQTKSRPAGSKTSDGGRVVDALLAGVKFEPVPELAGEWSMVSGVMDGHPMDQQMVQSGRRVANGNETRVTFGGRLFLRAMFTVDKSKTPHAIEYYHIGGMNVDKRQSGIYELDGDLLKLSFAAPGDNRPEDFTSQGGDGRTVTVWKKK